MAEIYLTKKYSKKIFKERFNEIVKLAHEINFDDLTYFF